MDNQSLSIIGGLLTIFIVFLVMMVVFIVPYFKIYQRTGQSGWMALLQFIPLINIIMLYILAFGNWPIEDEMRQLRMRNDAKL